MAERQAPTRGFVTIATGKERYFRMAHALLLSYRLASANPLPFAIMTDRRNRYTEDFDDVVILENARGSYMDKLRLLTCAPYDETIFIDADCIAFGDLNRYWEDFAGASDFTAFGSVLPLDAKNAWFTPEGAGKYGGELDHLVYFHGGIYFIRKGETCERIHELAMDIAAHYNDYQFLLFKNPADEPILALAMTLCGCLPTQRVPGNITLYNFNDYPEMDFFRRKLRYRGKGRPDAPLRDCLLLHFGSSQFDCPDYLRESRKVRFEWQNHRAWMPAEEKLNVALCRVLYAAIHSARTVLRPLRKALRKLRRH